MEDKEVVNNDGETFIQNLYTLSQAQFKERELESSLDLFKESLENLTLFFKEQDH